MYSNLNKQNSDIRKEILDLKQEQINQQTDQKEGLKNLQDLVINNWEGYANTNESYGFSFKYPEYASICDITEKFQYMEKAELNLILITYGIPGDCDNSRLVTSSPVQIIVKKNIDNYKTAEEAFYKEFTFFEKSSNPQLGYIKLAKLDAYGGAANDKYSISNIVFGSYKAIVIKNDYIIKFSSDMYSGEIEGRQGGAKPILDTIISSLYFYQDAKRGF